MDRCALCNQHVSGERRPIVLGSDGYPEEAAATSGCGVPVQFLGGEVQILLNGEVQHEVVAYSRPNGWILQNRTDANGKLLIVNGHIARQRRTGTVTLRVEKLVS